MARVVNGNGLPPHVLPLCLALGGLFMLLALLSTVHPPARRWCPSGIGVAVGMYVSPCALFGCAVCTVLYEFSPLLCASQIIRFTGAQGIPEYKTAHSSSLAARACTNCLAWAGIWWFVTVCGQQVRMRGHLLCHCFVSCAHTAGTWRSLPLCRYTQPPFTLVRCLGCVAMLVWRARWPTGQARYMLQAASGLVLGEGILSAVVALLA